MADRTGGIEEQFAEAEKRVRAVVSENASLRARAGEMEQELVRLRREVQDLQHFHGRRMHVREKIERILQQLEETGGE